MNPLLFKILSNVNVIQHQDKLMDYYSETMSTRFPMKFYQKTMFSTLSIMLPWEAERWYAESGI